MKELNLAIFKMLIAGYNELAFTHEYVFGFTFNGTIYAVRLDSSKLETILTLDKASRGAGFALRFCPTKAIKTYLLTLGAVAICSEDYFKTLVEKSKYNKGEIFEKLVTEKMAHEKWEKDNLNFVEGPDATIDGVPVQIKFEKATFTNEQTLANLQRQYH